MHTELINRPFGLIRQLNPVLFDEESVSLSYEPWEFFRGPNRELIKAQIVVGCFLDVLTVSAGSLHLSRLIFPATSTGLADALICG